MNIKTIDDANFAGKRVLVRVDFNVPLNGGEVADDTRIRRAIPTIKKLVDDGAKVIIMSHLGRPIGEGFEAEYSLQPVSEALSNIIGRPVVFANDIAGDKAIEAIGSMGPGDIVVLENLRFDAREKKNDEVFASELASLADVYVDDAFGCAHRAHASIAGVPRYIPGYAGYLLKGEVETLSNLLDNPSRPFVAVLGGAKVSDKIKVVNTLLQKADTIIIGGGMAFTFLKAQGKEVGNSLLEEDYLNTALEVLETAKDLNKQVLLPVDAICASEISDDAKTDIYSVDNIPSSAMGLDIGPETEKLFSSAIASAKSVFWNGPMGVFECAPFSHGTESIALAMANNNEADTIIGGGDSVSAVNKCGLSDKMTFISTGGGASMKLVEGDELPGVEALLA